MTEESATPESSDDDSNDEKSFERLPGADRSAESQWSCPCGWTGRYNSLVGHRKGYKKRPACQGKIFPVSGPLAPPEVLVEEDDSHEDAPEDASPPPKVKGWNYDDPELLPEDPEELAALLMREARRGNGHTNGNGHGPIDNSDLLAQDDFAGSVAPGEFSVEPGAPVVPSQYRETVYLSAKARVIYDWARAHGWKRGDGSMSAFVLDVLTDHFEGCWGKQIVVVEKADMELMDG